MAEPTLNKALLILTRDEIRNQRPLPNIVTITAIHNDNYIDIIDNNGDILKNIECIGTPTTNKKALLIQTEQGQVVII